MLGSPVYRHVVVELDELVHDFELLNKHVTFTLPKISQPADIR